ncbi:MAG: hypothetical protein WAW61_12650, partial [Methylococcaceae bacterium]
MLTIGSFNSKDFFLYLEAAALAEDYKKKATAYNLAGFAKFNGAKLLNEETHRQQKTESLSQAASYFNEAATLYPNPAQKATAYN